MARIYRDELRGNTMYIVFTRKEAADIIALLVGQLASVAINGNQNGSCPDVVVIDEEYKASRFSFAVEPSKRDA